MSSPDNSDTDQQAIDEIRARIINVETDAIHAAHELQYRTNPEYVKRQIGSALNKKVAKLNHEISQNYEDWRVIMFKTLTKNPLPTALVGLGMFLLMKHSSDGREEGNRPYRSDVERWRGHKLYDGPGLQDRINDNFESAKGKVREQVSDFQNRATELKDQASQKTQEWKEESEQKLQDWKEESGHKIQEMKEYVKNRADYAKGEFNHILENNPLALGGILVAIGAVVATTLPSSRKENQWMGDSREKMLDAVKSTVKATVEDVKQETTKLADNVSEKIEAKVKSSISS